MKITLTTWERVRVVGIIAEERGTSVRYRKLIQLLDVLELSEEEQEAINYREIAPGTFTWDGETEYELKFGHMQWNFLQEIVNNYKNWDASRLNGPLMEKFE